MRGWRDVNIHPQYRPQKAQQKRRSLTYIFLLESELVEKKREKYCRGY